jgi:hypothetical protein
MKLSKNILFIALMLLFFTKSYGQSKLWQKVINQTLDFEQSPLYSKKYIIYNLDLNSIKSLLSDAPLEYANNSKSGKKKLKIPLPNGNFEEFEISESPIMEAELALKYPEIKTYSGYSVNNPSTIVRFDYTPKGFHSMILSTEGTYFIDPIQTSTGEYYLVYDKKDYVNNKSFKCELNDDQNFIFDSNAIAINEIETSASTQTSIGDGVLRTYRLALAATGEYTTYHGGTKALALAAQVTTMNRVNGIFLRDIAVRMILVANNDLIIYTDGNTDPYSNENTFSMLSENITNVNTVIGTANYDIGHVFSTSNGGVAYLRSPCGNNKAGGVTGLPNPTGDPFDIDYVAHEIGHQFGANHTQNNNCQRVSTAAFEPGSASTIMGYAGICIPNVQMNSDAYFHAGSLTEMHNFITGTGNACSAQPNYTNAKPTITTYTQNQTIPKSTPFMLTSEATDPNGNASLTYCWEQMDNQVSTQPPLETSIIGPNFRSYFPSSNSTRYFPNLNDLRNNISPTWEKISAVGRTFKFRLVVRDNAVGGGANDHKNIQIFVNQNSGPFILNAPSVNGIIYAALSSQTITWDVAGTNVAPISCLNVDILLSTDGGLTYPITLATNIPNNGSSVVTIPNVNTNTARIMIKGHGRAFFDISNNNFTINACTPPNIPTSVSVNKTKVCLGSPVILNASCSAGTITWYNLANGGNPIGTGNNLSQSPNANTTYYAACENGNCKSNRIGTNLVSIIATNTTVNTNFNSGTTEIRAIQTITANNKVNAPAIASYKAGNFIILNAGFEVKKGSVFLAKIEGCP